MRAKMELEIKEGHRSGKKRKSKNEGKKEESGGYTAK